MPLNKQPLKQQRDKWKAANWANYQNDRILILWQVAALSLGAEPELKNIKLACEDSKFKETYELRKKSLKRMLSVVPSPGHVTYFPNHELNRTSDSVSNRMVDVVSCIEKLSLSKDQNFPAEFLALNDALRKVPLLVQDSKSNGIQFNPTVIVHANTPQFSELSTASKSVKKDQSEAVETKRYAQVCALLHAVACDAYAYEPKNSVSEYEVIKQILEAVKKLNFSSTYGLGKTNIKDALETGYQQLTKK